MKSRFVLSFQNTFSFFFFVQKGYCRSTFCWEVQTSARCVWKLRPSYVDTAHPQSSSFHTQTAQHLASTGQCDLGWPLWQQKLNLLFVLSAFWRSGGSPSLLVLLKSANHTQPRGLLCTISTILITRLITWVLQLILNSDYNNLGHNYRPFIPPENRGRALIPHPVNAWSATNTFPFFFLASLKKLKCR